MRRIVYPMDRSDHQNTFAWTRELAELTHCNLMVALEEQESETNHALANPQIASLFAGTLFKDLVHLLDEKEDLLVMHPQTFKHNPHLASIINTKIPVIILPVKIALSAHVFTGRSHHEEIAQLFYKTLRRSTKYRLPKALYEKLGRDTRIFNMIAAYFRKNFNPASDQ